MYTMSVGLIIFTFGVNSESTGRIKQSLNYQLNILRREGLVCDIADPKDRRCRSIGLTDKGRMVAGWV